MNFKFSSLESTIVVWNQIFVGWISIASWLKLCWWINSSELWFIKSLVLIKLLRLRLLIFWFSVDFLYCRTSLIYILPAYSLSSPWFQQIPRQQLSLWPFYRNFLQTFDKWSRFDKVWAMNVMGIIWTFLSENGASDGHKALLMATWIRTWSL